MNRLAHFKLTSKISCHFKFKIVFKMYKIWCFFKILTFKNKIIRFQTIETYFRYFQGNLIIVVILMPAILY